MDTIVLKLHNVKEKYSPLLKILAKMDNGFGTASAPSLALDKNEKSFRKIFYNIKYDSWLFIDHNKKLNVPSSNGTIKVQYLDYDKTIKFEYSIPKLIYSNNVMEILPPFHSRYYSAVGSNDMTSKANFYIEVIKKSFIHIIESITNNLINEFTLDWSDVQIFRLDLCYNQLFQSKEDALNYLDAQKKVSAKRIRKDNEVNNHSLYKSGLTILTSRYYYKIYHKGIDFERSGKKQIVNYFNQLKTNNFVNTSSNINRSFENIDSLQIYSDKLLRYELECKNQFMSYNYAYYLMKNNLPIYREIKRLTEILTRNENVLFLNNYKYFYKHENTYFETLKNISTGNNYTRVLCEYIIKAKKRFPNEVTDNRLIKKYNQLNQYLKKLKKLLPDKIHTLSDIRLYAKYFHNEESKSFRFFLGKPKNESFLHENYKSMTENELRKYPTLGLPALYKRIFEEEQVNQHFNEEILIIMIKRFNELFLQYQLNQLPSVNKITTALKDFNKNVELNNKLAGYKKHKKINEASIKLMTYYFSKGINYSMLQEQNIMSRKTIYNYKKRFEALLNFSNITNFVGNIDLENIVKSPELYFSSHYALALIPNSIIQKYLNSSVMTL